MLWGVLVYVAVQIAIGAVVSRRIRSEDDYLVAGRRVGFGLCLASVFATWFGAETCLSAAGGAYADGLGRLTVEPFAYGLCLLGTGLLFAVPLWRLRLTTLADFLRERYSPFVERLTAILIVPTSVFWAAAQIRAFGLVLHSVSDVGLAFGIGMAAVISVVYTMLGGVLADIVTDLVQGVVLVIGLLWLFVVVAQHEGGFDSMLARLDQARVHFVGGEQPHWSTVLETWAIPVVGSMLAPELLSRAMAAKSAATARWSMLGGGALYVVVGLVPITLGLLGPSLIPSLADPDRILPELAQSHLSRFGVVVLVGALVSAILSTIDSAMLVAASLLSRNVLLAGRVVSERARLRTARGCVLALGAVAWALASSADSVFDLIEDSSGFGSAGIFVCVSAGLFTRVGDARAATGALLAGAVVWGAKYVPATRTWPGVATHPYLCALGAATVTFVVLAAVAGRRVGIRERGRA
ncbi:MAG: sodium:solute symporter [Planctomycetota bacterium]